MACSTDQKPLDELILNVYPGSGGGAFYHDDGRSDEHRKGEYAWQSKSYSSNASSRRSLQIEMQKALHNRMPVIISWFVDFNSLETGNTFRKVPDTPGRQGGHMVFIVSSRGRA